MKVAAILIAGSIGTLLLVSSHAATPSVSVEAESGVVATASKITDSSASAGHAIKFSASTHSTNQKIGVIGDSLTYMDGAGPANITAQLVSQGWTAANVKVDGLPNRGIEAPGPGDQTGTATPYTNAVIDSWRAAGFDPHVWLIALGTNNRDDYDAGNPYWQTAVQSVITKIDSGPAGNYVIYWMGTGYADIAAYLKPEAFDAQLTNMQSTNSNLHVCSYNDHLAPFRSNASWKSWWADIVHNTSSGYATLRTPFYSQCVASEAP